MNQFINRIVLVFAFILFITTAFGQLTKGIVKGMLVEVETKDGMNILGTVEKVEDGTITLSHENYGEMSLATKRIKSIEHIRKDQMKGGDYWHENKNYSRNFYAPTGMGLKKGDGYYQNIELVWNHFAYAFSDYFTLGFDFEVASILARFNDADFGGFFPIMGITPKFSFPVNDKFHVGAGALFVIIPFDGTEFFSLPYVVGTFGNKDKNFTIGYGVPLANELDSFISVIMVSGQTRVSRSIALVSENWIGFGDGGSIYAGVHGLRYIGKKVTWDFGLILAGGEGEFFVSPIPYVGIMIPFQRN